MISGASTRSIIWVSFLRNRYVLTVGVALALAGCSTSRPIARPADGYDAIKFNETVTVTDHGVNEYEFLAGTVLTSDRAMEGERQIFCGLIPINGSPLLACIGYEGDSLVIGPGGGFKRVLRPIAPGVVDRIKR